MCTGEGAMIISSALGSNTMDILLCLGLPWLVKCLLPTSMNGGPIRLQTDSLFFNCMCMIVSVVVLIAMATICGFQLHRPFGFLCLIGLIIVLAILIIHVLKDPRTARCWIVLFYLNLFRNQPNNSHCVETMNNDSIPADYEPCNPLYCFTGSPVFLIHDF